MLRVPGRRCDFRVRPRRAQTERRMDGIVVRVNQVVRQAGMVGMGGKQRFEYGRRSHVDREVAAAMGRSEQRQRVKRCGIHIVRVLARQAGHGVGEGKVAAVLVAVAVQDLDGAHVVLLAFGSGFRDSRLSRRCEASERLERRVAILLHPHGVGVGHRLAPVGHREVGVELLRFSEQHCCCAVFEVVKLREAFEKEWLRCGRARVGKAHFSNARRLSGGGDGHGERGRNQDDAALHSRRIVT